MDVREKARRAIASGHSWFTEKTVGRSLGRTTYYGIPRKSEVHPALIRYWKQDKAERRKQAKAPFTYMNLRIRRCLKDISSMLGLRETGASIHLTPNISMSEIVGPNGAFEPHSGLAWYALEIERRYDNARRQVWDGNAEAAAMKAFELGQLYAEFQMMRAAGEFFEQAVVTKERQRDAGRGTEKRTKAERMRVYFEFIAAGDKPIEAARNAASRLRVSITTIRNAFPGARLPKEQSE